jgi:hypothetical protein
MIYGLSADLVLIVHLGFVLFVVLGGLLVRDCRCCAPRSGAARRGRESDVPMGDRIREPGRAE